MPIFSAGRPSPSRSSFPTRRAARPTSSRAPSASRCPKRSSSRSSSTTGRRQRQPGRRHRGQGAPDGYTLLLCDTGALAISPSVYTKLPFDPSKDLRGVTMLAYSPHLLVVHPSVQASNLKELVALSQKSSDLNFAVTAMGSAPHLAGVGGARQRRQVEYMPYKGGSQAVTDTVPARRRC
jgi:hypothetical protein